jgi:hypothetical protein
MKPGLFLKCLTKEIVETMNIEMLELSFLSRRVFPVLAYWKSVAADLACQRKSHTEPVLLKIVTKVQLFCPTQIYGFGLVSLYTPPV